MKLIKCAKCGKMLVVLAPSACPTMCCGEPMQELVANSTDAVQEKHVPVIEVDGNKITITVSTVEHPMNAEHLINDVFLETKRGVNGGMHVASLMPGQSPQVVFMLAEDETPVTAYAYCNLHGLWKADL